MVRKIEKLYVTEAEEYGDGWVVNIEAWMEDGTKHLLGIPFLFTNKRKAQRGHWRLRKLMKTLDKTTLKKFLEDNVIPNWFAELPEETEKTEK